MKDIHVETSREEQDTKSLKGTLFSVMMVGAFIAFMWFGVFWLFMERY